MNAMMTTQVKLTREQLAERVREYQLQIAPIVRQMAKIEALRPPPRILLHPDGRMDIGERAPLPAGLEETMAQCRAAIDYIRTSLFPDPAEIGLGVDNQKSQ